MARPKFRRFFRAPLAAPEDNQPQRRPDLQDRLGIFFKLTKDEAPKRFSSHYQTSLRNFLDWGPTRLGKSCFSESSRHGAYGNADRSCQAIIVPHHAISHSQALEYPEFIGLTNYPHGTCKKIKTAAWINKKVNPSNQLTCIHSETKGTPEKICGRINLRAHSPNCTTELSVPPILNEAEVDFLEL